MIMVSTRLSERISMIEKDLVLHAVLNPSGSWNARLMGR